MGKLIGGWGRECKSRKQHKKKIHKYKQAQSMFWKMGREKDPFG